MQCLVLIVTCTELYLFFNIYIFRFVQYTGMNKRVCVCQREREEGGGRERERGGGERK